MKYKGISADGHVNEPPNLWVDRLPAKYKDRGPRVIETPNTHGHAWICEGQSRPAVLGLSAVNYRSAKRFDRSNIRDKFQTVRDRGVRYEDLLPGSYDPVERLKEMSQDQIDAEVIFNGFATAWAGVKTLQDPEFKLLCFQAYNDWMSEFCSVAPDRLIGNGTLPTSNVEECIAELERCAKLGVKSCQLESWPSGSFTDISPEDDRFWAAAESIGLPINVHLGIVFDAEWLRSAGSRTAAQSAALTKVAEKKAGISRDAGNFDRMLARMILTGVFDRFPNLKFVGTEVQSGWIPYYLEQFDESVRCYRTQSELALKLLPSEYYRRNVHVAYVYDEVGAENRYLVGLDNMMWGPDYPHSISNWPIDYELGHELLERVGASRGEIDRIMWKNAADLYGLPYEI